MVKPEPRSTSVSFLFCLVFVSFPVFSLRHKGGPFPSPLAFLQRPAGYLSAGGPPLQQQQQQQAAAAAAALNVSEMLPRVVSCSLRAVGPRGLRGPPVGSPFLGARDLSSTAAAAVTAAAAATETAAAATETAAAATAAGGPRRRPFTRTKQVATIGPASWDKEQIEALYLSGVDVFRLNFSHGLFSEKHQQFKYIREVEEKHKTSLGVLADLPGPKLRLGRLEPDEVTLKQGQEFILDGVVRLPGNSLRAPLQQPEILRALQVGNSVLIDDGKVKLRVIQLSPLLQQQQQQQQQQEETEEMWVRCVVEEGGPISSKKGVSVPRVSLPISALTDRDKEIALMVSSWGVDFLAVSFVQQAEDIVSLRSHLLSSLSSPVPLLVAKIEKQQAVENIESIAAAADALMVARGDLGLDVRPEEIPRAQKDIIEAAKRAGKPVIVATQMLESMMVNPMPLRAETADVAAAVFDGADAVMLSGETAAAARGPSIAQMQFNILQQTEKDARLWSLNLLRSKDAAAVFAAAAAASPFAGVSLLHKETPAAQPDRLQGGVSPAAGASTSAARPSPSSSAEVSPSAAGVSPSAARVSPASGLPPLPSPSLINEAMARGAHLLSRAVKARAILAWSDGGEEASLLSLQRPEAPVIAVSHNKNVARRLQLYWGVYPVHLGPAAAAASEETDTPQQQQQAGETPEARLQKGWLETAKREAALCGILDDSRELFVVVGPRDEASQGGPAKALTVCSAGDASLHQECRVETAASAGSENPSGC